MHDEIRFILVQDDDCHWYVIPQGMRRDWDDWCLIVEGDETPTYATRVGGSPSLVSFTEWKIG